MKKFIQKLLSAVILITAISLSANAQTNVSGGIYANTTWTLANSPYIVVDTVVVFPGVTLTIEPGVVVKFDDHEYIEVRQAAMIANGNTIDSITFTSNSVTPSAGIWVGIRLTAALGTTSFNFCNVKYAAVGIDVESGISFIKNSNFTNNVRGLWHVTDTPIDSCIFRFNNTGIDYVATSSINFCTISNNNVGIIILSGGAGINNCRIDSNQVGISQPYSSVILNCIISYNQTGVSDIDGGNSYKNCMIDYNGIIGILLEGDATDSIINCEIKFNGIGLQDQSWAIGNPGLITQCVMEHNVTGIQVGGRSNIYCNKFCNNTSYDLENLFNTNYSVPGNYWCSTDSATIASHIYDGYDDVSLGLVTFGSIDTLQCYLNTSIEEQPGSESLLVFPNPFTDQLSLILPRTDSKAKIKIINLLGETERTSSVDTQNSSIDVSGLAKGIYVLEIMTESRTINKRIIKQ
jgi:hypothetical protein